MTRTFMAVCVVCLLCAKHLPCKDHFVEALISPKNSNNNNYRNIDDNSSNELNFPTSSLNTDVFQDVDSSRLGSRGSNPIENNDDILTRKSSGSNYDDDDDSSSNIDNSKIFLNNNNLENLQYNKRKSRTKYAGDEKRFSSSSPVDEEEQKELLSINMQRDKRHSDHHHHHKEHHHESSSVVSSSEHQYIGNEFLKRLFKEFGNDDGTTMNVSGFEAMLRQLGLYKLIEESIPKNLHINASNDNTTNSSTSNQEMCISTLDLIKEISLPQEVSNNSNKNNNSSEKLMNSNEMKFTDRNEQQSVRMSTGKEMDTSENTIGNRSSNEGKENSGIDLKKLNLDFERMYSICPLLLYKLITPESECIPKSLLTPPKSEISTWLEGVNSDDLQQDRIYVWIYSISSILGVSLVGLLGVAVIPCMDRHFYQHIIQFLVALAVGTLAGDALLHLLPHSMMSFSSEEEGHGGMVWKGLVAVLGIVFFFATERGLTMIAEWRKKIEKKEKPSSRVRVMRDPDSFSTAAAGDKLCKHKYSSYPYCYDEIAMDTKDDHHHHHQQHQQQQTLQQQQQPQEKLSADVTVGKNNEKSSLPYIGNNKCTHVYQNNHDHGDHNETAQSLLPHNYTTISDNYSVLNKDDSYNNHDNNTISTNLDESSLEGAGGKDGKSLVREETFTIILREHESSHHGHSHKHGHVHSPPRSLSAVAWMVIMGDGLHNFTDGMAIGAAFSNNIAGGFSTAIAVFCHELPHELGDFAVLLKAGMSAKQAVYYNLLSSVLSFFGMILGVLIGDTPEASAWIFACAAGMFIYIALVDMMPELTSTHQERCALSQCLLQIIGMCTGLGIMMIIALYEHDLKQIFSTSDQQHNH